MKATGCCTMFLGALDDFMLKLLMVCSVVSITVEFIMVDGEKHPQEYYYCWIDGFAIMVAVLVVSGVGSIVDYRKEIEFVKRRNESDAKKSVWIKRNG